ncbi:MAG: DJ-1/PfpI family protein [Rhodanobacteraceae bacterium]|nr:DJ-1/PfpI family protein [Rhodanobacteraceae bacterium]
MTLAAVGAYIYYGMPTPEYAPYTYGRPDRAQLPRLTLVNHEAVMAQVLGTPPMRVERIGILVYDGVDTLEAVAPMAVFSELMNVKLEYLAVAPGVVRTRLADLVVERSIGEVESLDVLIVPGGSPEGIDGLLAHAGLREWLQRIDASTQMTAGIGLGNVILADAGLLAGKRIAFGWPAAEENAAALGARHVAGRHARDGKYWSSLPATAALDLSLAMLEAIAGRAHLQAAMLDLEYDPSHPCWGALPRPRRLPSTSRRLSRYAAGAGWRSPSRRRRPGVHRHRWTWACWSTPDSSPWMRSARSVCSPSLARRACACCAGAPSRASRAAAPLEVRDKAADAGPLDVLLVPGGADGTWALLRDPAALDWIRETDRHTRYTTSVCTGSWVLGAAGLLRERRATSNWYRLNQMMARWGATPVAARHVRDGKLWTSAGVSAGIDLGFALIADLEGDDAARAAMLRLHYRPDPPIDAGSPESTDDLVLDMMHQMYDYSMVPLIRAATP